MKICHTCQQTYSDDVEFCPRDGARLAVQAAETEVLLAAGLARRYRLVRRLGQGGMGTVFLARQIGVGNRPVALKVLNRKLLDDPQFLLRFQNEAGSTGLIRHPNVVSIYESAQADDGTPYIAMEYLEGESLRDVLQRRGALPVPEVAEILQQAARGLNAAHKLGIIHRDLKPDNIFLTYSDDDVGAPLVGAHGVGAGLVPALPLGDADIRGHPRGVPLRSMVVKVVDFGIAKLRESATHTQTGMVLGTPAYMSYEQASGLRSDELDARSDVYSLAVVVYEMLTGRVPFHSDTPVGYLRKHLMEEPPPFRTVAPGLRVPPAVESVVMKALVKGRDQRYASVLDFARDFARAATLPSPVDSPKPVSTARWGESAMPQSDVGAVREPPLRDHAARPQPKKKSTAGIASLVVAVVVVIVVALAWVYWPGPAKPPRLQPGPPQQQTTGPAKPETPVPAPSVYNPQINPPGPQVSPAQIVVQTSTNAQVYLDDTFKGQVGRKGRLVIEDLKAGDHTLRVSLVGKKDYEHGVTVAAGQVATITATLADAEQPSPPALVATPRPSVSQPRPDVDLVLQVAATERAWVAVDADGSTVFQRVLNPDEVQTLKAHKSFDVTTGNAQAIILTLNGETLKPLGRRGEVKLVHLTREDLKNSAP
jgi:serine/threonine-protein kinase